MTETMATVLVAALTTFGSVLTALIGWLARKGVDYVDHRTQLLDETGEIQRKEAIKQRIVDTVTLVARATMQTYVDTVKAQHADGKLTPEEAAEAFRRTRDQAQALLARDGVDVGREVLDVVVEAVVSQLKGERPGAPDVAAA